MSHFIFWAVEYFLKSLLWTLGFFASMMIFAFSIGIWGHMTNRLKRAKDAKEERKLLKRAAELQAEYKDMWDMATTGRVERTYYKPRSGRYS